jgi:ABC-type branched-subunit amino acid transport system permease subunit
MMSMMLGTMIGGAGTVLGPLLGTSIFGILSEGLRHLPYTNSREAASAVKILYAFVLIVIVLRLPGGLLSLVKRKRAG